jgi:RimJ/RimL family protein N-acetyltransferase
VIAFEKDPYGLFASWLCKRIDYTPTRHFRTIARVEGSRILGVAGYDNWNQASCAMHICGEGNWLTRDFLFAAFDYPFNVCSMNCVFGLVPSGNEKALKFDRHLGFSDVVELERAHEDGSLFLLRMFREDCRWLEVKDVAKKHRTVSLR